ncbi:hypothetical protein BCR36DRAFT_296679 [Piromyces finnis]|uniref:Uncharacterized protein n=1 Tax=Piromyces finnis TaxID=1754191 RepID=A0A1Y1V468_9FUNG|nr:hypothetical protein BCR36DRAFT_296679 [Piromyces finnis]|eukprot:ORX46899.1 hypothetical protein BCR36DRAFT_296679 [Piromyces finnis]
MSSYIYQSSLNSQPSSNFDTSDSNSSPYLALFNNSNIKSRKNPLFIQRQITKEPLACDIIKQARASLKHPTRPITPLERRRSSLSSGQNSLLDSYNEVQQNSSHLGANFGLPFKSRNINTGIKRNNEVKIISRPYRLKPIDPSSLKNLHILQSNENTDHQNNTILDNSNINQNKSDLNDNGNTLIERKEYEGNNCLNKSMEELSINNEEIENKNQDRPLTTSELIVSLIRCPLSDLKPEEKKNLLSIINNVIKNHNFSIPLKSKMNHWKTKPIHAQFIIDCCGNILCV